MTLTAAALVLVLAAASHAFPHHPLAYYNQVMQPAIQAPPTYFIVPQPVASRMGSVQPFVNYPSSGPQYFLVRSDPPTAVYQPTYRQQSEPAKIEASHGYQPAIQYNKPGLKYAIQDELPLVGYYDLKPQQVSGRVSNFILNLREDSQRDPLDVLYNKEKALKREVEAEGRSDPMVVDMTYAYPHLFKRPAQSYDAGDDDEGVVVTREGEGEGDKNSASEEVVVGESVDATAAQGPSIAQAKPQAIAMAGPGGVAAASPVATAIVGPGGMAIAAPSATAVAGPTGGSPPVISPASAAISTAYKAQANAERKQHKLSMVNFNSKTYA